MHKEYITWNVSEEMYQKVQEDGHKDGLEDRHGRSRAHVHTLHWTRTFMKTANTGEVGRTCTHAALDTYLHEDG